MRAERRSRHEHGAVVLLLPVCVLVVFVLAALAVDYAHAFLGQRDLANAVAAAANDAAAAVDPAEFYESGAVELDRARAVAIAGDSLAARAGTVARVTHWAVAVVGANRVEVRARGAVDTIFARALPGGRDRIEVQASASSQAVPG